MLIIIFAPTAMLQEQEKHRFRGLRYREHFGSDRIPRCVSLSARFTLPIALNVKCACVCLVLIANLFNH